MLQNQALPAHQKANEEDLAGAIKYATQVNGKCTCTLVVLVMKFICRLAHTMEDLPPRFHQSINDSVAQSIGNAFENQIPAALQHTIQTALINALNAALPPLLAPLARQVALTRVETKMERMETKLTCAEIMLAKVCPHTH